jgi:hypothetical protein
VPFDPVVLRYLTEEHAQLLAAAWPVVAQGGFVPDLASLARWSEMAGVPTRKAILLGPQLISVGICLPDGRIPDEVRAFVAGAAVTAARVNRKKRQARART